MEVIQNYMLLGQEIRVLKNENKADFSVSKLHVTPRALWVLRMQKV